MNFFDSRISLVGDGVVDVATRGLGDIRIPKANRKFTVGEQVQVAIRPEKFFLSYDKPQNQEGTICGTLENSAYLGERSHYFVRLDDLEKPIAISAQNSKTSSAPKDRSRLVWLHWNNEAVVLLDASWKNFTIWF